MYIKKPFKYKEKTLAARYVLLQTIHHPSMATMDTGKAAAFLQLEGHKGKVNKCYFILYHYI